MTIKWTIDAEDGDRHATVDGIRFTICRAKDHGKHVFQLCAYNKDGEEMRRLEPWGWGRLKWAVSLAEDILAADRASHANVSNDFVGV